MAANHRRAVEWGVSGGLSGRDFGRRGMWALGADHYKAAMAVGEVEAGPSVVLRGRLNVQRALEAAAAGWRG